MPAAFTLYENATGDGADWENFSQQSGRWWESFNAPELDTLVEQALAGNFSVQLAAARLHAAAAEARIAGAPRSPGLSYDGGASVTRNRRELTNNASNGNRLAQNIGAAGTLLAPGNGSAPTDPIDATGDFVQNSQNRLRAFNTLTSGPPSTSITTTADAYDMGLSASYEIDLWGRIRADYASAQMDLEASREDLHAAMESVAAQVVLTWLDLLEVKQEIRLVQSQLESNRTTLELVQLRFQKGLARALDVFQQRQAVARTEATLPVLESQQATLSNQLDILLGKAPQSAHELNTDSYPALGPPPPMGIPADLLARRPDIRAAGLRLRSADWAVTAARADRLPALRLSATASLSGGALDQILDEWLARLAASITGPIFDGGRRQAVVDRARAVAEQRLATYRQTVILAVGDVQDALVREAKQRELIVALRAELDAAQATRVEALNRYRKGLNDYLPVLSALTNAQSLERSLVQAEGALRALRVDLALSLGGTWMAAYTEEVQELH